MNQSLDVATPETPNIARFGAADQLIDERHLTNFPACHLGWAATSLGRQVAGKFGGQLMRGILGSLFK